METNLLITDLEYDTIVMRKSVDSCHFPIKLKLILIFIHNTISVPYIACSINFISLFSFYFFLYNTQYKVFQFYVLLFHYGIFEYNSINSYRYILHIIQNKITHFWNNFWTCFQYLKVLNHTKLMGIINSMRWIDTEISLSPSFKEFIFLCVFKQKIQFGNN